MEIIVLQGKKIKFFFPCFEWIGDVVLLTPILLRLGFYRVIIPSHRALRARGRGCLGCGSYQLLRRGGIGRQKPLRNSSRADSHRTNETSKHSAPGVPVR